jgi:hypothetical protein
MLFRAHFHAGNICAQFFCFGWCSDVMPRAQSCPMKTNQAGHTQFGTSCSWPVWNSLCCENATIPCKEETSSHITYPRQSLSASAENVIPSDKCFRNSTINSRNEIRFPIVCLASRRSIHLVACFLDTTESILYAI